MWSLIGWIILVWAGCALGWVIFFNLLGISFRLRDEVRVDPVPIRPSVFKGADAGSVSHQVRNETPPAA